MYTELFAIIAPIFICAVIGYSWARSGTPFAGEFVTRLVMNIGAPCLIVGTLGKVDMPGQHFVDIIVASSGILLFTAIAAATLCKLWGLSIRAFINPLCFSNTGNIGLPLSLFAFGEEGLAVALGIFLISSLALFTLGPTLLSRNSSWRQLYRTPIVYAGLITVTLIFSGWHLPAWLQNTCSLLGDLSIPLMLITLGVSLAQLRVDDITTSIGLGAARLVIGFAVGVLVCELLSLQGVMRGVVIIQSSMPVAVFNYLLAQRYQHQPEAVAGMVVSSTLLGFATLPLLLWFVL